MTDTRLYLNGINGATGQYLTPPVPRDEVASRARHEPPPDEAHAELLQRSAARARAGALEALPFGLDPLNVARAGWAVVFSQNTPPAVRTALQPLIEHR